MTTLMWLVIGGVTITGAVFAVALAALRYWVAFWLFFFVYVVGVMAAAVQAVLTS